MPNPGIVNHANTTPVVPGDTVREGDFMYFAEKFHIVNRCRYDGVLKCCVGHEIEPHENGLYWRVNSAAVKRDLDRFLPLR